MLIIIVFVFRPELQQNVYSYIRYGTCGSRIAMCMHWALRVHQGCYCTMLACGIACCMFSAQMQYLGMMSQQGDLDGQMRAYHCLGTVYKAMKDHRKTQECFEQVCLTHYTTYQLSLCMGKGYTARASNHRHVL